jgi:hypothetical protein
VTFDYADFNDPAAGYKSTATITPDFSGKTPTGPVTWSVENVVGPVAVWWGQPAGAKNGLSWGTTPDSSGYMPPSASWPDAVLGVWPAGPVAQLTDVVGSRTVKVKAETTIDGVLYSRTIDVTFGDGPLSVFTSFPVTTGLAWATLGGTVNEAADFVLPTNTFPAAAHCGGTVNNTAVTITGSPGSQTITYPTSPGSGWTTQTLYGELYGVSTTSKLPNFDQIAVVSNRGISNFSLGKGAAQAAGWPMATNQFYLTSYIRLDNLNNFNMNIIYILPIGPSVGTASLWHYATAVVCIN